MPNREILEMFLLLYAAPAILLLLGWKLLQRHAKGKSRTTIAWLVTSLAGIYFLFGYAYLERQWPWQFFPITRSAHWFPIGIVVTAVLSPLLDVEGKRLRLVFALGLSALAACFLYLLLRPYINQLDVDRWSPSAHRTLFAGLVAAALAAAFGHMRACRHGSTRFAMVPTAAWFTVAGVYLFYGAASAKVAQWAGLGAVFAATLVLAGSHSKLRLSSAGLGWTLAFATSAAVLYALYASSRPELLPAICLLAVPWGTLLPAGRHGPILAALWAAIALALCVYFTMTRESEPEAPPGGGYDDIYGIPAPRFPNEKAVMRV